MSNWITIPLLLIVLVAIALWRERRRVTSVETGMVSAGFTRREPVAPDGLPVAAALVRRINPYGCRIWGLVLDGSIDGVAVTAGEHEGSEGLNKPAAWHTVVVWAILGATGPVVVRTGAKPRQVEGEPVVLAGWLTPDKQRAIDAWPHGGTLVRDAGHGAWRLPGTISPETLATVRQHFAAARHLLE